MTNIPGWIWHKRYHIIVSVLAIQSLVLGFMYIERVLETSSRSSKVQNTSNTNNNSRDGETTSEEKQEKQDSSRSTAVSVSDEASTETSKQQESSDGLGAQLGVSQITEDKIEEAARNEWFRDNLRSMIGKQVIQSNLQRYDRERIWKEIKQRTDISREDVPENVDVRALARDLIDASLSDLNGELQKPSQTEEGEAEVQFTTAIQGDNKPEYTTSSFSTDQKRIFACFRITGGRDNVQRVFVKWINLTDEQILLFEEKKVQPMLAWNYVWYRMDDGWDPGDRYGVKIYQFGGTSGGLQLMGANSYSIQQ